MITLEDVNTALRAKQRIKYLAGYHPTQTDRTRMKELQVLSEKLLREISPPDERN